MTTNDEIPLGAICNWNSPTRLQFCKMFLFSSLEISAVCLLLLSLGFPTVGGAVNTLAASKHLAPSKAHVKQVAIIGTSVSSICRINYRFMFYLHESLYLLCLTSYVWVKFVLKFLLMLSGISDMFLAEVRFLNSENL